MPSLKHYLVSGILTGVISASSFGLYLFASKDNSTIKRLEYLAEYIPNNILEYPEYTIKYAKTEFEGLRETKKIKKGLYSHLEKKLQEASTINNSEISNLRKKDDLKLIADNISNRIINYTFFRKRRPSYVAIGLFFGLLSTHFLERYLSKKESP